MVFRKMAIAKLTLLAPCNTHSEPTLSMSLTLKFNERIPLVAAFANLCQEGALKKCVFFIHACARLPVVRSEVEDEVRLRGPVGDDGTLPPAARRVLPRQGLARVERRLEVRDELSQL